jgi:flap endonuclease-1
MELKKTKRISKNIKLTNMGIKNFSTLLKEKASSAFIKLDINDFYGKRIAIDLNNLMYRYFSSYLKEEIYQTDLIQNDVNREKVAIKWINGIIDFGLLWLEHGVTPIFVLDGDTRKEKEDTKQKRINEKKKARDLGNDLLNKIRSSRSLFDVSPNDLSELRKNMSKDVSLKTEEVQLLKKTLEEFRFPVLDAKYDSEQLCCSLAIEGKVEAVYSTDMDCLVYGTPFLITEFDKENREKLFLNVISLEKTLENLDLTFTTFVDLCIMCGCDFNQNIPKIGPKRSYDLMKEYHSIDDLPENYDIKILEHKKCREIFTYESSGFEEEDLNMRFDKPLNPLLGIDMKSPVKNNRETNQERKWREGRLILMMKQLPKPESKPYFQMPQVFDNRYEIVIV